MYKKLLIFLDNNDISYEIFHKLESNEFYIQAIILNTERKSFIEDMLKTFFEFNSNDGYFEIDNNVFFTIKNISDNVADDSNMNYGQRLLLALGELIERGTCIGKNVKIVSYLDMIDDTGIINRISLKSKKIIKDGYKIYQFKEDDSKIELVVRER